MMGGRAMTMILGNRVSLFLWNFMFLWKICSLVVLALHPARPPRLCICPLEDGNLKDYVDKVEREPKYVLEGYQHDIEFSL